MTNLTKHAFAKIAESEVLDMSNTDPVFAAIAARREIAAALRRHCDNEPPTPGTPEYKKWERQSRDYSDASKDAELQLFVTVPTTREGLAAYVDDIRSLHREGLGLDADELELILRTIALAIYREYN